MHSALPASSLNFPAAQGKHPRREEALEALLVLSDSFVSSIMVHGVPVYAGAHVQLAAAALPGAEVL